MALAAAVFLFAIVHCHAGVLSKTGVCPSMEQNFQRKENRLNFFGQAFTLIGEDVPDCFQSECRYDGDCEGDNKCCKNNCGASVCTTTEREPHPCQLMKCPENMICKIQRVHCQMPYCQDLYARGRPSCVHKPNYYANLAKKRSEIFKVWHKHEPGPDEVKFVPGSKFKSGEALFQ